MLDFKKLHLPVDDINRLFSQFLEIDTDGSGEISLDEFYAHFALKRSIFSDMAFSLMDEDKSGEIDFREFVLTLWNFCSYDFKELCRFAFFLFDTDESGKLEKVRGERGEKAQRMERSGSKSNALPCIYITNGPFCLSFSPHLRRRLTIWSVVYTGRVSQTTRGSRGFWTASTLTVMGRSA